MKCLGVDVGGERVGIAVSDDSGFIAFPLMCVTRDACVSRILSLIDERGIDVVVFGESVDLDGTDNPIMKDVREVAGALGDRVMTVFEPEQFSTQAARRLGRGRDDEAAAVILQSYLDRRGIGKKEDIMFD